MELRGASALVTGAGRGIGRAVALALGRAGAKVTLVARSVPELDAVVAEIRAAGGKALEVAGDLPTPRFPRAPWPQAVSAHGRLQVLVNNAGVGAFSPLAETTDEAWDDIIGTNLTAVFRLTRAALPHLTNGGGHVFMVSSLAGTNAIAGMSAYCASKAALDHLSACLMLEVRGARRQGHGARSGLGGHRLRGHASGRRHRVDADPRRPGRTPSSTCSKARRRAPVPRRDAPGAAAEARLAWPAQRLRRLAWRALIRFLDHNGPDRAAAVAYYTLLSLLPLLIFLCLWARP